MKKLILIFYFLGFTNVNAQLKPITLNLKSDKELQVIGKIKSNGFLKYKSSVESKTKKIHLSEIDYLKMENEIGKARTFRYLAVKNKKGKILVEEVLIGSKVNLYAVVSNGLIKQAGFVTPVTLVDYYVKRPGEAQLTSLGIFDPLVNNMRNKVLNYFYDCDGLVSKIQADDLKVSYDMEKIIGFYNTHCH